MAPRETGGALALVPGTGGLGLACSGGGDSVAMLRLAADWSARHGIRLEVATVDHGLRPDSGQEAADVAALCQGLGLRHQSLLWHWDGHGNLQAEAREGRRRLLLAWAAEAGLSGVMLGHTANDQAETVLMRLARGSGVDGLAGMAAQTGLFLRPLLAIPRESLRDYLRGIGQAWVDDPSNDNPRFDRVKARQMMDALAPLGLSLPRLVQTAAHMARAQTTLRAAARQFAERHIRVQAGDLLLSQAVFDLSAGDSPARVLAAALQWIGAGAYRPRYEALCEAAAAVLAGQGRTLAGVRLVPEAGAVRLSREHAAIGANAVVRGPITLWEGRWQITAPTGVSVGHGLHIGPLGEAGLAFCPDWRATGLPWATVLAGPAVWSGTDLIAAPLAGWGQGWQVKLGPSFDDYLLSH